MMMMMMLKETYSTWRKAILNTKDRS